MQLLGAIEPLYIVAGFLVGVLVGMTGVGGGSLMTPVLILLFNVHPAAAVGTDLLFAAATKSVGTLVHGAARTIDWRLVGWLATGSVPGTAATLVALSQVDLDSPVAGRVLTIALAVMLLLTSVVLLCAKALRARFAERVGEFVDRRVCVLTVLLGLAMGVLVSATSVGAGAIGVTVLLLLHPKMPIARIVGSDIAHAVPLTLVAGGGHWFLGSVNWGLLGTLLLGSIPGIMVGSYFAARASDRVVRTALALTLSAVAIKLLV
jgi:uncharacterized membrane protein YfcA